MRQVLKDGGGCLSGKNAKDDDLVFDAKFRQGRRNVAGRTIADQIAQPLVVAGMNSGGQFVRGTSDIADDGQRVFSLWTCELLFHLRQGCANNVMMMHMRADRFDSVQPDTVNQIKIVGG